MLELIRKNKERRDNMMTYGGQINRNLISRILSFLLDSKKKIVKSDPLVKFTFLNKCLYCWSLFFFLCHWIKGTRGNYGDNKVNNKKQRYWIKNSICSTIKKRKIFLFYKIQNKKREERNDNFPKRKKL